MANKTEVCNAHCLKERTLATQNYATHARGRRRPSQVARARQVQSRTMQDRDGSAKRGQENEARRRSEETNYGKHG